MCKRLVFILIFAVTALQAQQQQKPVWQSDNGDGTYTNPVLNADYSDPDAIRVGDVFYMTASSFNCIPGLPILKSYDLVNWSLIGHALVKQPPYDVYSKPQHGNGVWAPCLRYHNNEFYIYYPDPDYGIYVVKSKKIEGPWSVPVLVKEGKGLIDPSPLWDDNGKAYLVYAFAGSRAGVKSMLTICSLSVNGLYTQNDDVLVFDGHDEESTVEGPKIYKKEGFYYIFAPAGGVATGWQTVFRSKSIYGPYEKRKVMHQGATAVNGPHQGAWVQTAKGEDWFLHFQDKGTPGRVVHLQPMKWQNDWPIIGEDKDGDGIGEPVTKYRKPNVGKNFQVVFPPEGDEFNIPKLGLQWQWHANPQVTWGLPGSYGYYMLNCIPKPEGAVNLYDIPNLLLQKFPNEVFTATAKVECNFHSDDEEAGLVVMGLDYGYLKLKTVSGRLCVMPMVCTNADKKQPERSISMAMLYGKEVYLRVKVDNSSCTFSYSEDGVNYTDAGTSFKVREGKWIGAKVGFTALRNGFINDAGNIKIDWIRIN
ncbi:glycoside hydrolase 43 family protein [Flavobacterium sp. RHBU_3]|uniref:glycoside hydrolase family 43 protein n=1 Tax=Flavobacterium sp. RHBU_3 TaxID=3391184 RepID=UPI00398511FF